MARLANYVIDTNPFSLAGPPNYFLRQLWEFDPSLVIVPSRQGFYYRLTQRRPLKLKENIVNDILKEQADTRMLASHGLVPITTILATARWDNPMIFVELQRRAPWRMGGAEKFTELLEGQEQEEAVKQRVVEDERLSYLAKDSWKFYNKLIGTRSHLWSPTLKPSADVKRANVAPNLRIPGPVYRPETATTWVEPRKQ